MRTGEKDAAPKTNMEPKNWWFVDVSPSSKGGIFRFRVSIDFFPRSAFGSCSFHLLGQPPQKGHCKDGFLHFCWSNSVTPDNSSKNCKQS